MPVVQHMVVVKMKPEVSEETITEVYRALGELKNLIPGILSVSGGPYASPEGLHQGFTHGFLVTFESPEARNVYLPHPDHETVKDMILPLIDEVVAFDFEVPDGE